MEIASLTKIMTLYTVLTLVKKFSIDLNTTIITVPRGAVLLGGTTAYFNEGDSLTLIDLLYALMLPSGNDAAYTLATYFGKYLTNAQHSFKGISLHL